MDTHKSTNGSTNMDTLITAIISPDVDTYIYTFDEPNMGSDEFTNQSTDNNTVEYTLQCSI
jgi:hypothetical protein